MALLPYTGPFGTAELRHLLRRTLFGCSVDDLNHFNGMSLTAVVQELLTFTNNTTPPIKAYSSAGPGGVYDPALIDPVVPFGSPWPNVTRQMGTPPNPIPKRNESLRNWWTGNLVHQERNIREKLTLFWYNHMPIQVNIVFTPELSYKYCQLLRDKCKGNVPEMLKALSTDGAMLLYLNGAYNMAGTPDENYGRELMELFTLGEGSGYTQEDVAAAARIFTGWSITEGTMLAPVLPTVLFNINNHDQDDKQFSSFFDDAVVTGANTEVGAYGEISAFVDVIFSRPEAAKYICRKLYRWFVGSDISPETEADVIAEMAQLFIDEMGSPVQVETVLQALLTSDHFFGPDVRGCMVKTPSDLTIGWMRELRMPMPTPDLFEAQYNCWNRVREIMDGASQAIGEAPNVAGWPAYYQQPQYDLSWIDSSSTAARIEIKNRIMVFGFATPAQLVLPDNRNLQFKVDLLQVVAQFDQPSDPDMLLQQAADLLFGVPVSAAVLGQLKVQYLLQGQLSNYYWSDAYTTYVNDPATTDPSAMQVPQKLQSLFYDMMGAAECQLH
ncbi:MAG: DUF1800 domain-containing protein [Flavobacteriales bacterium]|jgi:uncharacterized protein (DUF1800 family)|nr:DUF1800 domain-containing protein [Flavobacteriales bacterium]